MVLINQTTLVDLRNKGISGSKVEYLCEKVDIHNIPFFGYFLRIFWVY